MALFTISGLTEVERALRLLAPKVARKVIRQALRKALKPVLAEVRRLAPVGETGQLKVKIKLRAGKGRRRGQIVLEIRVGEGDFVGKTFYAAFVEFGTSKMDAKPYMRPAFDAKKAEARAIATREIRAGIEREASQG